MKWLPRRFLPLGIPSAIFKGNFTRTLIKAINRKISRFLTKKKKTKLSFRSALNDLVSNVVN